MFDNFVWSIIFFNLFCICTSTLDSCDGCKIIVDADIGADDAMGIAMLIQKQKMEGAGQYGAVEGITTVTGNTDTCNATRNAKVLLETLNLNITLYQGGTDSLTGRITPTYYYGYDGFGDFLPASCKPEEVDTMIHAAIYIAETVRQSPGKVTLLFLGPLTNLGLALHINTLLVEQVNHIFILGGDYEGTGNVPGHPDVEANMYGDPDAAAFFFHQYSTHEKVTLIPIEPVLALTYTMEFRNEVLGKIKGPLMALLNKAEQIGLEKGGTTWYAFDQTASGILINPQIITSSVPAKVSVKTEGSRGAMFAQLNSEEANVNLVTKLNKELFVDLLIKYLKSS